MKTKFITAFLATIMVIGFSDCKKVIVLCGCHIGDGKDTTSKDTSVFATTAQLKLDSFRNGQIGKVIGSFDQFSLTTYKMTETYGAGIEGGTVTNTYDLNDGWRAIKYNDYPPNEPDAYIIYELGQTLPVKSTTCGGTVDVPKTLIFIPEGKSFYTTSGWVLISNQTLLFDENHSLPYDDATICSGNNVYAASNETWAMYFSFY